MFHSYQEAPLLLKSELVLLEVWLPLALILCQATISRRAGFYHIWHRNHILKVTTSANSIATSRGHVAGSKRLYHIGGKIGEVFNLAIWQSRKNRQLDLNPANIKPCSTSWLATLVTYNVLYQYFKKDTRECDIEDSSLFLFRKKICTVLPMRNESMRCALGEANRSPKCSKASTASTHLKDGKV